MIAVFGWPFGRPPFETWYGLWLNLGRCRIQRAIDHELGQRFFHTKGELPMPYYDAMASSEEEAEELEFWGNTEREKQAAIARARSGG